MLWAPNELGFARAYVSGDVDIEGDIFAGLSRAGRGWPTRARPGSSSTPHTGRRWPGRRCGWAWSGRRHGRRPRRPARRPAAHGGVTPGAIAHHYDVGNDFYALVLGASMTYSCAYLADGPASAALEAAQGAKCDLVAASSGCAAGMRVLDVGCGGGRSRSTRPARTARAWSA